MAICGTGSAKHDKQLANRGVRRIQNRALRLADDFEEFLLPDEYECPWNETYKWGRDGNQLYWNPNKYDSEEWFKDLMRK
jgi:hypothetical protein